MTWINHLFFWVPFVTIAVILMWLFYLEASGKMRSRLAGIALIIVIGVTLLQLGGKVAYFYFQMRGDEFGKFLLPGHGNNYFFQMIWNLSEPYAWSLGIALGLVLVLFVLKKIIKAPLFDRSDLYVMILTVFVVGPASIPILILGSFVWMLLIQIFYSARSKKIKTGLRLDLAPFLLMIAFVIVILNNLDFYWKFLAYLHLI